MEDDGNQSIKLNLDAISDAECISSEKIVIECKSYILDYDQDESQSARPILLLAVYSNKELVFGYPVIPMLDDRESLRREGMDLLDYVSTHLESEVIHTASQLVKEADRTFDLDYLEQAASAASQAIEERMKARFALGRTLLQELPHKLTIAAYAHNYPRIKGAWQRSEDIYKSWIDEARKYKEDLHSAKWKPRVALLLLDLGLDAPDDLLNRLVKDASDPLFDDGLDCYMRTASRIAAIHTARLCEIPDDLSYETYMRYRREGKKYIAELKKDKILSGGDIDRFFSLYLKAMGSNAMAEFMEQVSESETDTESAIRKASDLFLEELSKEDK